jgi:hypothetical protein
VSGLWFLVVSLLSMPILLVVRGARSRLQSVTRAIVFACVAAIFTLLVPRALFGRYVPLALWVMLVPAIAWNLWRARSMPATDRKTWKASVAVTVFTAIATLYVGGKAIAARRYAEEGVPLQFPLHSGTYVIAHGGSELLYNQHVAVHAQTYALDISKVNALGFRARGLYPSDVHRYAIFGDAIFSPCTGKVIVAVDEIDDLSPPDRLPRTPGGNHVVVHCQGVSVILAHMMRGSVRVAVGDAVTPETILGAVGNSGNTSEPHLHIHAVRGEITDEKALGRDGEPVPMLFDGRFLIRNDVVESR